MDRSAFNLDLNLDNIAEIAPIIDVNLNLRLENVFSVPMIGEGQEIASKCKEVGKTGKKVGIIKTLT